MSKISKEHMLSLLTYVSRKEISEGELVSILENEIPNIEDAIKYSIKEKLMSVNTKGRLSITEMGLKTALHLFEKPPHIREKMKTKFTKRRGLIQIAILHLLNEERMHGYQVMKLLEERSGGTYSASAGTVYPALQDLHEKGLLVVEEQDEKKIYALNGDGVLFLKELTQENDEDFWLDWRFRISRKQSKEGSLLKVEIDKLQLEFQYAMKIMLQEPSVANELLTVVQKSRQSLIKWSEEQEKRKTI